MKQLMMAMAVLALVGCGQQAPNGSAGGGIIVLSTVVITPDPNFVEIADDVSFAAFGYNSDGSSAAISVTWSSGDTGIATIDSLTGLAHGVAVGSVQITATVVGSTLTCDATLHVLPVPPPPPDITTTTLPNGVVGTAYSQKLNYVGGAGTPVWSVISGSLPAGLLLNSNTGYITGVPTTASPTPVAFTVELNATGVDQQALTITITAGTGGTGGFGTATGTAASAAAAIDF